MRYFTLLLLGLCLFVACGDENVVDSKTAANENSATLEKLLKETVDEHKVPGAAMLIRFGDGSIWEDSYGFANIANTEIDPMTTGKQFRIGSVSKTFIGTSILILVKEGKINLSDTIETLMPGLLAHGSEITLEMVLDQTSAIPNYTATDGFVDIYYYNPTYSWTHEEIYSLFKDAPLLDVPGNKSYYSNSNYYLLGSIIEKYSGMSLDRFLQEKVFLPLNMKDTYFPTENDLQEDYAHGYLDVNQDGLFTEDEDYSSQSPKAIWAAGGIVSTIEDLLLWSDELFTGTLLNEELQAQRMIIDKQMAGAPEGVNYGLGIANLFGAVGHTGAVAGYSTILFRYNNATFIAFGNGYATTGEKGLIAEALFEKVKTALSE